MEPDRFQPKSESGHFDIKITASNPEDQEMAAFLEPIATKLLEGFLTCWNRQLLLSEACPHNPKHEDVHVSGGEGVN
jgi:hypothetical protein